MSELITQQMGVHVEGLWLTTPKGDHLLSAVTFDLAAGELVVIAGPSGAGKTTLLRALAGLVTPAHGTVAFGAGRPADAHPRIGYVPQEDILHQDLALGETLRYAARLRLGEPARQVTGVVDGVVRLLGLEERVDVRVRDLSGGQRKRASIAVELLARPDWLFLDEPTSGLDPLAASVSQSLRALVGTGVTVVTTSHDPAQLDTADLLVLLSAGGRLAFCGSPEDARAGFGLDHLADVYRHLQERPAVELIEPSASASASMSASASASASMLRPRAGRGPDGRSIRRWWVLTRRTAALMVANRLTLAVLLGSPALVIAMMTVLFTPGAFNRPGVGDTAGPQLLFWIAFAGFFFGLTYGLLQVVAERDIQRREAVSGVGPWLYIGAKLAVLLPILTVINAVLLTVMVGTDRLPSIAPLGFAALLVTLILESTAAAALGLLASAAVSDTAQAALALPMLCFPQVLFGGAIVPIDRVAGVGRVISSVLANRWAFEALGRSLPSGSVTARAVAAYPHVFTGSPLAGWIVLAVSALLALGILSRLLRR